MRKILFYNMKILLSIFAFVLLAANADAQVTHTQVTDTQVTSDTVHGRLIKTITTRGQFVSFDRNHPDRFFFRDASDQMEINIVATEPETDLFLADHAKDDFKITYQIRDATVPGGKTEWLNYATMLRSLKTGDNVEDWPSKLAADSDLLERDREQLAKLREP